MAVLALRSGYLGRGDAAVYADPVCGMDVGAGLTATWRGHTYGFCASGCRSAFLAHPEAYVAERCPVCATEGVSSVVAGDLSATFQDETYRFCTVDHLRRFQADPAGTFLHTMYGIPEWLYYVSIAAVLVLSFGLFEVLAVKKGHTDSRGGAGGAGVRFDLLRFAAVRRILVHPATRFAAQAGVVAVFAVIVAAGLFGNQLPSKNIAPLLTWTVWWGGLILLILYLGKLWCYVCPWDAIAGWAEGLRFWGVRREGMTLGLRWPNVLRNIWPATALFVALTWVEIGFGVTMKPRATAWLGLAMLTLAFVSAFLFDRKAFCRYGCLVGRVSGLYALFAPVEIRARDGAICRSCQTHSCYKGNDLGEPCPTSQFLGTMDQNTYCISCLECVKSCERENVSLNLRPWGADLSAHAKPRPDEAYLALAMLALTAFHGLTMTGAWSAMQAWLQSVTGFGHTAAFTAGMAVMTVTPVVVYAMLVGVSRALTRRADVSFRDYFVRYAYALLPIALFYHLAHNSEHLLMEGQKLLVLASDPFGWEWDLLGTASWRLAPLVALPTLWGIQVLLVLVGHVYSLWVARRTATALFGERSDAFRSQLPMLAAMVLFSLFSLWLLKQPMVMRTSAM